MNSRPKSKEDEKLAIIHQEGQIPFFLAYLFHTKSKFSEWKVLHYGEFSQGAKLSLEKIGIGSCEKIEDISGWRVEQLALFPVSMSVANWFVVRTKNLTVTNLTAALDGFRNFGIIGPRLKAESLETVSFLSDAPDTLFLRDLTSLRISSTQVTVEKDALSLAFKSFFSNSLLDLDSDQPPMLTQTDGLYLYRDGWNSHWAPTLDEQFSALQNRIISGMKIERLIVKGPRDELQGGVTEQHLAKRAKVILSDDLEIVTWGNLLSRFGEQENSKIEELHIKGKLGEPKFIFQYDGTTGLTLSVVRGFKNVKTITPEIFEEICCNGKKKMRALTEQAVWLKDCKEALENEKIPDSFHGANRRRYLAQARRDHRRSVFSFLLSKLTPRTLSFVENLLLNFSLAKRRISGR